MSKIGIDMLDVGKGDAYVVELRDELDNKFVMVIDGGTAQNSKPLINHVNSYHNGSVDLVVCTHPDTDHIGGLIEFFKECHSYNLFINDPRDIISKDTLLSKARNSLTSEQIETFKSAFDRIDDLKREALRKQTVHFPKTFSSRTARHTFSGWKIYILGPSEQLFKDIWLSDDVVGKWFNSDLIDTQLQNLSDTILDDKTVDTQPVNNSSIIILIEGYGKKYLFTGDAGKRALRDAMIVKDISNLTWLDVPHHGSRRNMDSEIIKHFSPQTAFISSDGSTKHPRKVLVKTLQKNGSEVFSTCKHSHIYHNFNMDREGWTSVEPWTLL